MSEMMSQLIFATKKLLIIALIVIAGSVAGHAPVSYTHLTLPTS